MTDLKGKRTLITGGTKGIGFATAERFARAGAEVIITGSSQASVDEALSQTDCKLTGTVCEMSSMPDLKKLGDTVREQFGTLDIYFANAGLAHFRPLAEMTEDLFDEVMNVNVKGLYFSIQQVVPLMPEGGVIVVTGSIAPRKGQDGMAVYGGSKGAARAIVRNLASELIAKGIRINCLAPGPVHTNIFSRMANDDEQEAKAIVDRLAAAVPLGRVGQPEEIAAAVEFMCSDGAAYMIGSELTLDGGKAEL